MGWDESAFRIFYVVVVGGSALVGAAAVGLLWLVLG